MRKAVEDKSAAVANRRKQLAAELEKLEHDAGKGWECQQADIASAQEAVKAAEDALQAARAKLGTAAAVHSNASHAYDRARDAIETELRATAHQEIDVFVAWCWDEWHRAQRGPISYEHQNVVNKVTGKRSVSVIRIARQLPSA